MTLPSLASVTLHRRAPGLPLLLSHHRWAPRRATHLVLDSNVEQLGITCFQQQALQWWWCLQPWAKERVETSSRGSLRWTQQEPAHSVPGSHLRETRATIFVRVLRRWHLR